MPLDKAGIEAEPPPCTFLGGQCPGSPCLPRWSCRWHRRPGREGGKEGGMLLLSSRARAERREMPQPA